MPNDMALQWNVRWAVVMLSMTSSICVSAEPNSKSFGFATVREAFVALSSRRDLQMRQNNGSTEFYDAENFILWTFPTESDPAYPSVIKQSVLKKDENVSVETEALCEASMSACQELIRIYTKRADDLKDQRARANRTQR